jgi:hypothetical protein
MVEAHDDGVWRECSRDRHNVFTLLLSSNADIHTREELKMTPLHMAAVECDEEKCKLLVSCKADVSAKDFEYNACHKMCF